MYDDFQGYGCWLNTPFNVVEHVAMPARFKATRDLILSNIRSAVVCQGLNVHHILIENELALSKV